MSVILNPILFYPASFLLILFALLAIKFSNIFYSLLSAIIVFFITGFFFYILGSEYNAVIQIAIYGVAIPVLLGLAVMFTDFKKPECSKKTSSLLKYIIFSASALFILTLIYLTKISILIDYNAFNRNETFANTSVQVMNAFAQGLFVNYIWSFELIAILLTIIVVGIAFLNTKDEKEKS